MRFAVLSDTHLNVQDDLENGVWWNRMLLSCSDQIAAAIVRSIRGIGLDFVVHCGDMTHAADSGEVRLLERMIRESGVPWYAVAGNHDKIGSGIVEKMTAWYALPAGRCYYARKLGDLYFIFLDLCCWNMGDGTVKTCLKDQKEHEMARGLVVPEPEMTWLEQELAGHRDEKIILVSHVPIEAKPDYPIGLLANGVKSDQPRTKTAAFTGLIDSLTNLQRIRSLIREHPNIRLCLAGHWHINSMTRRGGSLHCQTGAMCEYPFAFRIVDAGSACLEIGTRGLDAAEFGGQSLIRERGNAWVAGRAGDKARKIRLQPT